MIPVFENVFNAFLGWFWWISEAIWPHFRIQRTRQYYSQRRCVVTGGASGIGLTLVQHLLAFGARVFVVDVNAEAIEKLKKEAGNDAKLHTCVLDLTENTACHEAVESALAALGAVDVWFNNAGIVVVKPLCFTPIDRLRLTSRVNFEVPMELTKLLLDAMAQNAPGEGHRPRQGVHINFTSSIASELKAPLMTSYAGTKAGIRQFAASLNRECKAMPWNYPFPVSTSSVMPNVVKTGLVSSEAFERSAWLIQYDTTAVVNAILDGVRYDQSSIYISMFDRIMGMVDLFFPSIIDILYSLIVPRTQIVKENHESPSITMLAS